MGEWLAEVIAAGGYLGIVALMLLETVVPPVPSEVIMSLAGLQAARGRLDMGGVIAAGTAGAMLGNWFWYEVARRVGLDRFRRFAEGRGRWLGLSGSRVDRAAAGFRRWGTGIVCVGRVLPNMRSLISVPAGLLAMPRPSFLLFSTAGTATFTALLAVVGHGAERLLDDAAQWLGWFAAAMLAAALCGWAWTARRQSIGRYRTDTKEKSGSRETPR